MNKNNFGKKAINNLNNPDDLEKYLRVTNPGISLVVAACLALLLGLLAWGIWGEVATSINTIGVSMNGELLCYLSAADTAEITVGNSANFGGQQVTVSGVSTLPLSRNEVDAKFDNDYLVNALMPDNWAYQITFTADSGLTLPEGVPLNVSITTRRIAPISLILNN